MHKLATIVVLSIALVSGCKKGGAKASYKDRAAALAAKYAPKLGELSKRLPDLAGHAKDLPVDLPGADKLAKLLADNKGSLESAQDLLAKLPDKLGAESSDQAEKDLAEAEKTLAADVQTAEQDEKEEANLETTLDAAKASAAGSGGAAGSASAAAGSASATPAAGSASAKKK